MRGVEALISILKDEGVQLLFGNPGTTELPLLDALADHQSSLRYVLGLHEAIVTAMADGYAQAAGRVAVMNVHCSPGVGNALGLLYNAFRADTPILLTSGQQDQRFAVTEPVIWSDIVRLAEPYVKWATEVRRVEDLPRIVRRAMKIALTHPTGPVFLSLPTDVMMSESARLDLGAAVRIDQRVCPASDVLERAADLLAAAHRPILLAGDAIAQGDAIAEVVALAELLGARVCTEWMANRCSFPMRHPHYRGAIPRTAPGLRKLLEQHDVLCSIGGDMFTLSLPSDVEPVPHGLKTIHIDVDPWEIGKNYPVSLAITGDIKVTISALNEVLLGRLAGRNHPDASTRCALLRAERAAFVDAKRDLAAARMGVQPIAPIALMRAIGEALPSNAVIVDESISSGEGLYDFFDCSDAKSYFGLRGGGIGWGLPAAIGVKLALPDRPVVAIVGDGSAMFSIQALWTAARERIGVVFVIVNNQSYRILKQRVRLLGGASVEKNEYVAMDLLAPAIDFPALSRSLGVPAKTVTRASELGPALLEALESGSPHLLDVHVDGALTE
jgi:benzoylformate decarboxylase